MPTFTCNQCSYSTMRKSNYTRHLESKKHRKCSQEGVYSTQNDPNRTNEVSKSIKKVSLSSKGGITEVSKRYHSETHETQEENGDNIIEESDNESILDLDQNGTQKIYKCEICNKEYSKRNNFYRHRKHYCKNKGEQFIENGHVSREFLMKALEKYLFDNAEQGNQLSNQVENKLINMLVPTTNTAINQTNANNTNTNSHNNIMNNSNNTNNITLNNFGYEDTSHITEDFLFRLLKTPGQIIPKMVNAIHFNKDKPENMNIMIPNKREKIAKVYENGKWVHKKSDDVLFDMIDAKYFMVDSFYNDMKDNRKEELDLKMNKEEQYRYTEFSKQYDIECQKKNITTGMIGGMIKTCFFMFVDNRE